MIHNYEIKIMKFTKTFLISAAALVSLSVFGQANPTPTTRVLPLLSGYNVVVPTNATVGLTSTNVMFTQTDGKIVYSLSNTTVGSYTNYVAGDAFRPVRITADMNGDFVSNAVLFYVIGQSNLIPVFVTNGFGGNVITNWPLQNPQLVNSTATTNLYPYPPNSANSTNVYTISLYRRGVLNGLMASDSWPAVTAAETTAGFTTTVTGTGATPAVGFVALPTGFLAAGQSVYATISMAPLINSAPSGVVNVLEIVQPQP